MEVRFFSCALRKGSETLNSFFIFCIFPFIIKNLKSEVKGSDIIYLASDDDREGEAISWHLKEALKLDDQRTRRIVFREITKKLIRYMGIVPRQKLNNTIIASRPGKGAAE